MLNLKILEKEKTQLYFFKYNRIKGSYSCELKAQ